MIIKTHHILTVNDLHTSTSMLTIKKCSFIQYVQILLSITVSIAMVYNAVFYKFLIV